jgi:AraC-like DNA-binding protein
VESGELLVTHGGGIETFKQGTCLFFRRNLQTTVNKRPSADSRPFRSIFFVLQRNFLKEQQKQLTLSSSTGVEKVPNVASLTDNHLIKALFSSLKVYFDGSSEPPEKLVQFKKEEALWVLLQTDAAFFKCLFDFSDPWKVDLETFMEEHYKNNLTVEQLANFTARSISSFKRDFKKQFSTTPQRWITRRRLQEAYKLIGEQHKRPSVVYLELWFQKPGAFFHGL